jgi:3',5'-cyclic AMP phosphodiesterase CpdA
MPATFLHCSDIHLLSLAGVGPHRFLNKRATGGVNLLLKRRRRHQEHLFDQIMVHAREAGVDRLVVTGDLTNLALESEFLHVRDKLRAAGMPVTVIPGNHDAYTRGAARSGRFESYLAEFMDGERLDGADYPFVQRLNAEVALVGLSTAVATFPMYATGELGAAQLARLDRVLRQLEEEGRTRVVLIHHPVVEGVSHARHDLTDLDAFAEVIRRRGAELILHGHEHKEIHGELPGPGRPVPVHGIGSGTSISPKSGKEGAFGLYSIEAGRIERVRYVWDGGHFVVAAAK